MDTSVAELIADRIDAMPAGERRAAQTLIANYPLIGLKTVADFSQQAGVSSPTILRFVARLGFQNYPEFQSALQDELAAQLQSPLSRAEPAVGRGAASSRPMVEATLENIRETFRHVSEKQIADIVALLANRAPRPSCRRPLHRSDRPLHGRASRPSSGPTSSISPGQESNWRDRLIDMGKRDVLVIFDIRRYQDSLVRFAEKAHQRGVADRAVHRPVAVADRPLRPPRHRRAAPPCRRPGIPRPRCSWLPRR